MKLKSLVPFIDDEQPLALRFNCGENPDGRTVKYLSQHIPAQLLNRNVKNLTISEGALMAVLA
jgi:hypothetical protein